MRSQYITWWWSCRVSCFFLLNNNKNNVTQEILDSHIFQNNVFYTPWKQVWILIQFLLERAECDDKNDLSYLMHTFWAASDSSRGVMGLLDHIHLQLFLISVGEILYKEHRRWSAVLPNKRIYNSVVLWWTLLQIVINQHVKYLIKHSRMLWNILGVLCAALHTIFCVQAWPTIRRKLL